MRFNLHNSSTMAQGYKSKSIILALAITIGWPAIVAARLIDDFSAGHTIVELEFGSTTIEQTMLDQDHVLGGARHISVTNGDFSLDAGLGHAQFSGTLMAPRAAFAISYGSREAPLDEALLVGGASAFAIEYHDASESVYGVSLSLIENDQSIGFVDIGLNYSDAELDNGRVRAVVPFDAFVDTDFANIESVILRGFRSENPVPLIVYRFETVPEPDSIVSCLGSMVSCYILLRSCLLSGSVPG